MEWSAHLPIVGGGGVTSWYQSRILGNLCYTPLYTIGNHAFSNSKYIHIK